MTHYDKLVEFQLNYPELTFNNRGYEKLPKSVEAAHADVITKISAVLKESIEGFVKFNNFKPRPDGSFAVRVQYKWDASFVGVGYFEIDEFKNVA